MESHDTKAINQDIQMLYRVIAQLESEEEVKNFLADLCTIKEIRDMAQRLHAAILLDKGYSYQEVTEEVGISSATISRVSKCLYYGSGGYRQVLDQLKENKDKN